MTKKKPLGVGLTREERMVLVIGEIIQELLKAHVDKKDVNLNRLKSKISQKYGLESQPRLVDIIAAVPQESKKILLPKLKAKPVRTASGVSLKTSNFN
jgi:elongator complex protein 3